MTIELPTSILQVLPNDFRLDSAKKAVTDALGEAWDAGFVEGASSEYGEDHAPNPWREYCLSPGCQDVAVHNRKVCQKHLDQFTELLKVVQ